MKRLVVTLLIIPVICFTLSPMASANNEEFFVVKNDDYTDDNHADYESDEYTLSRGPCGFAVFSHTENMYCSDNPKSHCTNCFKERTYYSCIIHFVDISDRHTVGPHNVTFNTIIGAYCMKCGYVVDPI